LVNHRHRIRVARERQTASLYQIPNLHRLKPRSGLAFRDLSHLVRYTEVALNLLDCGFWKGAPVNSVQGSNGIDESFDLFIKNLFLFIYLNLLHKRRFKACNEVREQIVWRVHIEIIHMNK
jgi:hypothetical protein